MSLCTDDKEQLLAELAQLISRLGARRFIAGPLVLPTPEYFPEVIDEGPEGVRTLMRRLLGYAELPAVRVLVDDYRSPGARYGAELRVPKIALDSVADESVRVRLMADGIREWLACALTHEVARVLLLRMDRGMDVGTRDAYRSGGGRPNACEEDDGSTMEEERRASIASIYHGFGVIAANGTDLYGSREDVGAVVIARYAAMTVGGLAPEEASFLLATQLVVRKLSETARDEVMATLARDRRAEVDAFIEALRPERASLIARLGLGPEEEWAAPAALAVVPLVAIEVDDELEPERRVDLRRFNEGWLVFRVRQSRASELGRRCFVVGLGLAGVALLAATVESNLALLALPLLLGVTAGGAVYGRFKIVDRCSDTACGKVLLTEESECSACGGAIRTEQECAALERTIEESDAVP